ncbi:MAG: sulfatase, partial [Planctomycetota bacterium]
MRTAVFLQDETMMMRRLFLIFTGFLIAGWSSNLRAAPPNILFIAIDDMNDWTGFLGGHPQAKTPNMNALAKKGVNFTNAHCVAPACSPSRNALLYGVQPFKSGLYPFYSRDEIPKSVLGQYTSLMQFFKDNGYGTYGAGKVHHGSTTNYREWTEFRKPPEHPLVYDPDSGYQQGKSKKMAFCPTTNPLEEHPDHKVASYGIEVLSRTHEKPFFLAVGIVKPHLAFVCPKQFFDLYPDPIASPAIHPEDLDDVPWVGRAMAKINDDQRYRKDEAWERVRRAYLACISWADYNIGRVLDALANSPHADNTIVVLWSDHGYHLGEKRSFRKFSLWEEATRVPFIIWDPRPGRQPSSHECDQAVSLINIYRTLADLAGLVPPEYVDGESLAKSLINPERQIGRPAITTWGRRNYTVRSDHWRYIRYHDGSEELYAHTVDSNEWSNLAKDPKWKSQKNKLALAVPKSEAPLVRQGISLWNVIDADQPPAKMKQFKQQF